MKRVELTNRFKKDTALCFKRGYKMSKLDEALDVLEAGAELPSRYRPHILTGNWAGHTECHLAPDWLLIYRVGDDSIILVRTGTHADLF